MPAGSGAVRLIDRPLVRVMDEAIFERYPADLMDEMVTSRARVSILEKAVPRLIGRKQGAYANFGRLPIHQAC